MDDVLSRNWWAFTVRGFLALGFGFAAWAWPRLSLAILVVLFAAYAIDDGLFAIVGAVRAARRQERWWPLALEGFLGIITGLIALMAPAAVIKVLFFLIAGWALFTGVLALIAGGRLRRTIKGEWLLALSGVLRIAFGVSLYARRAAGLYALVWITALYAATYGMVLIGLSLRLRRHHAGVRTPGGMTPQPV